MESMHSMSEILFNQVEQIADVKTCNVDNVEQKYYKVQWKCTWEPATVLERFCGKIIADYNYNKHPKHAENTKHDDGMSENNISTNIVEKSVIDLEKQNVNREIDKEDSQIRLNIFIKEPSDISATNNDVLNKSFPLNNYTSANNLTQHQFESVIADYNKVPKYQKENVKKTKPRDVTVVTVNTEIEKFDSRITSNLVIKDPFSMCSKNSDDLNENLPLNNYSSANNLIQHEFESVNKLALKNFSIKPDPDQEVFANINILCESNPTTFVHEVESNTTSKEQDNFDKINNLTFNNFTIKPDPDQEVFPNINILSESNPTTFVHGEESNTTSEDQNNGLSTPNVKDDSKKLITAVSKIKRNRIKVKSYFKCQLCSFTTPYNSKSKRHMLVHTGEKPFKCNICLFSTARKDGLKKHMIVHTDEKPFKCSECSFSTSRKVSLKTHMAQHTGDYLFKCHLCSYSTSQNYYLKLHLHSKHTNQHLI